MQMISSSMFADSTNDKAAVEDEVLEISVDLYNQLAEVVPTPAPLDEISTGEVCGSEGGNGVEITGSSVSRYSKRIKLNNVKTEEEKDDVL